MLSHFPSFMGHNKIPDSLSHLSNLVGLHLQSNRFTGRIPSFDSPNLNSLNVSNNRLSGEIPSSLSKFSASSFAGNPGLCGKQVGFQCPSTPNSTSKTNMIIVALMVTLGVILFLVTIFFVIRWRGKKQEVSEVLPSGSSNDAVEVPISISIPAKTEERPNGACSDSKVSDQGKASVAELVMVNDDKGVFGLTDLMKASAEVLGNGPLGSSYRVRMANGVTVVVKRMRKMNALGNDAFDAEVKKLGTLRHPNILTPLAYHYRKDEKLFVYEYHRNGSLLYHLQGGGRQSGGELDWPTRVKIVRGIAKGLGYLHREFASRDVPHGNLKSSNVLLGPDYNPYLSEYGFHPLLDIEGLQGLFAYKTPEAIQKHTVSPKSDVYCLGIIILEMLTVERPSQYNDGNDGTDIVQRVASAFSEGRQAELLDTAIEGCRNSVGSMEKLLRVGLLCTETSPEKRLGIEEAIRMIEEIHEFRNL